MRALVDIATIFYEIGITITLFYGMVSMPPHISGFMLLTGVLAIFFSAIIQDNTTKQ